MHEEETLFSETMQVLITKKDYGNQIWQLDEFSSKNFFVSWPRKE